MGEADWGRLVLMGGAMLSKSLIPFSVDGWSYVPSLLFTWAQTMVEAIKIMETSFKRSHACTATFSAPNPAAGHRRPTPLLETPGHSRVTLGQSLVGWLLLSPGFWCALGSVCTLQGSISPVLCKLWQLYDGVNGDLLQEGLCHTQVCLTQPHPSLLHPEPLPLQQSTADLYVHRRHSNTVLSLFGSLDPGVHKVCLSPLSISGSNGVWF